MEKNNSGEEKEKYSIHKTYDIGKKEDRLEAHQLSMFPNRRFENTSFGEDKFAWHKKTGVKLYCDGVLTAMVGKVQIDVIKIDKELRNAHNYDCDSEMGMESLLEMITHLFGEDYAYIITKWTIF